MTLYFIGLGLADEKDISLKGLELIKKCESVYLENYTSVLGCSVEKLENLYGKKIILADRELVEKKAEQTILSDAKKKNVAFLVVGEPMAATTHTDLMLRAKELNIRFRIVHNASIMSAIGITGLQLYKFGKTTSIPFIDDKFQPETAYNVLKENNSNKMHTLVLLDLRPEEKRFMTVNNAIKILLDIEKKRKENIFTEKTLCIGCARIGSENQMIKAGKAKELLELDFGKEVHCLIVSSEMHFMEEEALKLWHV